MIEDLERYTDYKWDSCWSHINMDLSGGVHTYRGTRTIYQNHSSVFTYQVMLDFDTEHDLATVTLQIDGTELKVRVESPVRTEYCKYSAKDIAKMLPIAEMKLHEKMQAYADPKKSQDSSPNRELMAVRVNIKTVSLWQRIKTFFRTLFS